MEKDLHYIFNNYSNKKIDKARLASVNLVYLVLEEKSFSNLSFEEIFENKNFSGLDRKFASAITYGTISNVLNIDSIIDEKSKIKVKNLDPFVRSLLRTAIWQIFFSEQIPDFAISNESVKLIKLHKNKGNISFINAVLRSIIREKEILRETFITNPKKFYLKCKMPPELAGHFKKWYGEQRAIEICDSMNIPPFIGIRVNKLIASKEYVESELQINNMEIYPSSYMEDAMLIKTGGTPIEQLEVFSEGAFTIQDESAMLVSQIANPVAGQIVADVCAAPGGKSCHLAGIMDNKGLIFAFDINQSRLDLIKENMSRLKIDIIKPSIGDASKIDTSDLNGEYADLVLADVPCSGLGIIRKKPEIKFNMTHEKIISLYPLQKSILDNASKLVKKGGVLVYSTCTLNPSENMEQINEFLSTNIKEFELFDFSDMIPKRLLEKDKELINQAKNGAITIFPDLHGSDGFFIAKLRRK